MAYISCFLAPLSEVFGSATAISLFWCLCHHFDQWYILTIHPTIMTWESVFHVTKYEMTAVVIGDGIWTIFKALHSAYILVTSAKFHGSRIMIYLGLGPGPRTAVDVPVTGRWGGPGGSGRWCGKDSRTPGSLTPGTRTARTRTASRCHHHSPRPSRTRRLCKNLAVCKL